MTSKVNIMRVSSPCAMRFLRKTNNAKTQTRCSCKKSTPDKGRTCSDAKCSDHWWCIQNCECREITKKKADQQLKGRITQS